MATLTPLEVSTCPPGPHKRNTTSNIPIPVFVFRLFPCFSRSHAVWTATAKLDAHLFKILGGYVSLINLKNDEMHNEITVFGKTAMLQKGLKSIRVTGVKLQNPPNPSKFLQLADDPAADIGRSYGPLNRGGFSL